MNAPFGERLVEAVARTGVPLAVGIDPHLDRLPEPLQRRYRGLTGAAFRTRAAEAVGEFGRIVIQAVRGRVPAIKLQLAFYEQLGHAGWAALEETCALAREAGLLVVADGKRGDISSTAAAYARALLDPDGPVGADALTVNPWMGTDTLEPYMDLVAEAGRGIFVLVRTTNPGSAELQGHGDPPAALKVADAVTRLGKASTGPSGLSSVGAVVGAMAARDARMLRQRMPRAWFLTPGVGAQGGTVAEGLSGIRADGMGVLVAAARSVLYPTARDRLFDADPARSVANRVKALGQRICAALQA